MMKNNKLTPKEKLFFISIIALAILIFGLLANFQVITGNAGRMPVIANYDIDTDNHYSFSWHDCPLPDYAYLADGFNVVISDYDCYFSVGDILMASATLLIFINIGWYILTLWKNKRKRK